MRIPLIVSWPNHARPGTARSELVSTVDILPTLLRAAKVEIPNNLPGLALQPLLHGIETEWRRYVFGFTTGSFPLAFQLRWSIRDEQYKLTDFRTQTGDPFLDATNVDEFRESQLGAHDLTYRKTDGFRWPYLESFTRWRRSR